MRKLSFLIAIWTIVLTLSTPLATFQAAPQISDEAKKQLVSQAETFREERASRSVKEEKKPEIIVEQKEEAPPQEGGPTFFLKKINLEGATIFPQKELEALIAPYENAQSSFERLKEASQVLTNHYRAKGFLTSRAYAPPQKIENETATIKILEGKIGKIKVENNRYFSERVYSDSIFLRKDRIFYYPDLENNLYFLNRMPDRRAKAYLIAGETPATSDLVLKAEETYPIHVYYDFSNRGTKLTHRARHSVHFDNNNFSGRGDLFAGSVTLAEEGAFDGGFFSYDLPIESTRTTLSLDGSYVETMLIGHLKSAEVKGKFVSLTPGVTQNFYKKPTASIDGYLGMEIKDSKTTVDDFKINFDRTRAFVAGPRVILQDTGGRTSLTSDVHWGIPDFLGSSDEVDVNASRVNSGGDFLYYTGSIFRIQKMPWETFLLLRGNGQWTRDTLTSLEQYRAGGAYSVRGYPESDSNGDYGYNWSTELSIPVPFLPKDWEIPCNRSKWRDVVRFVGFLDGANTYFRERQNTTDVKDRFLLGTGFGLRVNMGSTFSMQLDLGWPIGDKSTDENQKQVHISLRAGF